MRTLVGQSGPPTSTNTLYMVTPRSSRISLIAWGRAAEGEFRPARRSTQIDANRHRSPQIDTKRDGAWQATLVTLVLTPSADLTQACWPISSPNTFCWIRHAACLHSCTPTARQPRWP